MTVVSPFGGLYFANRTKDAGKESENNKPINKSEPTALPLCSWKLSVAHFTCATIS
jgi:hypothetical protein